MSLGARKIMVQLHRMTSSQPLLAIMAPAHRKYSALTVTPARRIIGPRAMGAQQMKYTSGYMRKAGWCPEVDGFLTPILNTPRDSGRL